MHGSGCVVAGSDLDGPFNRVRRPGPERGHLGAIHHCDRDCVRCRCQKPAAVQREVEQQRRVGEVDLGDVVVDGSSGTPGELRNDAVRRRGELESASPLRQSTVLLFRFGVFPCDPVSIARMASHVELDSSRKASSRKNGFKINIQYSAM